MDILTTESMINVLRETLLDILHTQNINLVQINLITHYLNNIALTGDDDEKKTACRYLLVTRTNLPFESPVRSTLGNFEISFRTCCSPLLDSVAAFMPHEYVHNLSPEDKVFPGLKLN